MTGLDLTNEALRLSELGFRVFPIKPNQKAPPLIADWPNAATTDALQIEAWWGEFPSANIGICTTGLLIVDVDTLPDGKANDWPGVEHLAATGCPIAITPSGGRHFFFKLPDGVDVRNSVGQIAPNVDIRANGGYVVAAPSVTAEGAYRWLEGAFPDGTESPLAPDCLVNFKSGGVSRNVEQKTASEYGAAANDIPGHFAPGTSDNELMRIAGRARRSGHDYAEVLALVTASANARCPGRKTAADLERISKSACRYEPDQGSEMDILGVPVFGSGEIARLSEGNANRLRSELKHSLRRLDQGDDFGTVAKSLAGKIGSLSVGTTTQKLATITSAELDSGIFPLEYLIPGVLVKGQPCILAGPKKSLKTNILIDLTLSLANGNKFINEFPVSKPVRVALVSGESGQATIQETARRVAQSKPVTSLSSYSNALWCFDLPKLGQPDTVDVVIAYVKNHALDVLILDPAYLCMPIGDSASNLFAVGEVLRDLTRVSEATSVTIILCHHTRKNNPNKGQFEPPDLADIAWAGFAEWARQWLLLNRRKAYDPNGDGHHELWLSAGGSAGHSGDWAVDIDEGSQQNPRGRSWNVQVCKSAIALGRKSTAAATRKALLARETHDSNRKKLLDAYQMFPLGETATTLRNTAGMSGTRFGQINAELFEEGVIDQRIITKNGKRETGFRLKSRVNPNNPDSAGQIRISPTGPAGMGCESDNPLSLEGVSVRLPPPTDSPHSRQGVASGRLEGD